MVIRKNKSKSAASPKKNTQSTSKKKDPNQKTPKTNSEESLFPIVGIGSSAGGLEALIEFFEACAANTGMAFVIIPHLAPALKSNMSEIISKHTKMPSNEIKNNIKVEPDKISVTPPGKDIIIQNRKLKIRSAQTTNGVRHPIDHFFRSLACQERENSVAIVLSGTGKEGTLGIKEIKGHNGLVMIQNPETAKYQGMPYSARETGLADWVLAPDEMPTKLIDYTNNLHKILYASAEEIRAKSIEENIPKIIKIVRNNTGQDFSQYKKNTLIRRLARRMSVKSISDINDYIKFLSKDQCETKILHKEFFTGITSFFKDVSKQSRRTERRTRLHQKKSSIHHRSAGNIE